MTPALTPLQAFAALQRTQAGCEASVSAERSDQGWDFGAQTTHKDSGVCQCPIAHDKAAAEENEEILWRHVHGLWQAGKCDIQGALDVFMKQTLGLPVPPELELEWDAEARAWAGIEPEEEESVEEVARTISLRVARVGSSSEDSGSEGA